MSSETTDTLDGDQQIGQEQNDTTYSSVRMFVISLATIFTAEVGIMLAIHHWFPDIDPVVEAFADGTLLVSLVFPVLFLTIFKPMNETIDQLQTQRRDLETFREAVEHAGHSVVITDEEGTIEYANPTVEEMTGYSKDEIIGRNPRIWKSDEHDERFFERMWDVILSGRTFKAEIINEKKNGDNFVVHQTISPIFDDEGEIIRFVGIYQDVTKLKNRERQLREERNRATQLRQRISVLNRVLRHDIRSAVTVIEGHASTITPEDDTTDAVSAIERETRRLHKISEQARSIEQTISDDGSQTVIDVSDLVTDKVESYSRTHSDVSISVDVPDYLEAYGPMEVEMAFDELLSNAIEHNDNRDPEVHVVASESSGDMIEIEIADNGPGIPEGELEPLGRESESQLNHMSGLGLWQTYWIIEDADGTLEFESDDSGGTTVTVRLPTPRTDEDSGAARANSERTKPDGIKPHNNQI